MKVRMVFVLLLVCAVGTGCAQMRYSGRYQEVKIETVPPGAKVLIEGNIGALSPVGVKGEGGTELAYSSPMQLTTPVVVILDKDSPEYSVRIALDGYPEYEKVLAPRFAFHPYLIITFPVVPFWSDYEIKRFDDVLVNFEEYKAELRAKELGSAETDFRQAELMYADKCSELKDCESEIDAKKTELDGVEAEISGLKEEIGAAEEALESAEAEKAEELNVLLEDLKKKLGSAETNREEMVAALEGFEEHHGKLSGECDMQKKMLDDLRVRYEELQKLKNAKVESAGEPDEEEEAEED